MSHFDLRRFKGIPDVLLRIIRFRSGREGGVNNFGGTLAIQLPCHYSLTRLDIDPCLYIPLK